MVQQAWRGRRFRQLKITPQTPELLAGGLFNLATQGQGVAAVPDDDPPLLLGCSQQQPFIDPQAAICQPADPQAQFKSDFKAPPIGRNSGEPLHQAFHR